MVRATPELDCADAAASLSPTVPSERLPGWSDLLLALTAFVLVLVNVFWLRTLFGLMPRNDFGRPFLSAVAFVEGSSMYGLNPSIPVEIEGETLYLWNLSPPHFHLILLPLVGLPSSLALSVWLAANGVCLWLGLRLIAQAAGVSPTPRQRQLFVVGLLGFIGTSTALVTGHLSFLLFYLVTLSWMAARRGDWGRAGMWLGLGLSVKPFLLILVPYCVLTRRWRAVAATVATVLACFAVGVLVFGVEAHLAWKARLGVADGWSWLPMNASLFGALTRTFRPNPICAPLTLIPTVHLFLTWAGLCLVMVPLSYAATLADRTPRGVDRAFALLLVVALLVSPLGWTYYFWLPLGPLCLLVLDWSRQRDGVSSSRSRRLLLAAVPFVLYPLAFVDLGQPSPLATLLFGSVFCCGLLLTWLALIADARFVWKGRRQAWS